MKLFHYFSDPLSPFLCYLDEDLPTAQSYAEYAAEVPRMRMQGYDAAYFQKRMDREAYFRALVEERFGPVGRGYPVYTTLGREDARYFQGRGHRFSLELELPDNAGLPLVLCIGDSMYADIKSMAARTFFYEDFVKLSYTQVMELMPEADCDRFIEVQLWTHPGELRILPDRDSPDYLPTLSRCMLSSVFGNCLNVSGPRLSDIVEELREKCLIPVLSEMMQEAELSLIPPGRIHGVPHSFRCGLLAFVMALDEGLSPEMAAWTAKCAAYHDSGRLSNGGGPHAELVHMVVQRLFSPEQAETAAKVMRCHCEDAGFISGYFGESERELMTLASIVHDADTLDYLRLAPELGLHTFDPQKLMRKESNKFLAAALEMVLYSLDRKGWIKGLLGPKC